MTVLMLAPGASVHSVRPLDWLLARGCQVRFVDDRRPRPATRDGFRWAPYPLGAGRHRWLGWNLSHRVADAALRRLARGADIVHVHWVDHRAYACARLGLRPLVITVWGSDVNLLLEPGADETCRQQVGAALAAADLVLADSGDMPAKIARLAGRPVPTALLPLGIDTARFQPAPPEAIADWRRRLGAPADAAVLMSVRAWGRRYGHEELLEAFARARRDARRRAVLVFKIYNVGDYAEGPALLERLQARTRELGIDDDVRWLSDVPFDALPALYGAADAVLNYPVMDAFPVTFMEAAACQCPVVTVDLPAYRDTFVHRFFQVVPPGDAAALAAALRAAIDEDPAAARARLREARELMVREFDESVTADQLLAHYRRLAGDGATAGGEAPGGAGTR